jgi:hypothetical protein
MTVESLARKLESEDSVIWRSGFQSIDLRSLNAQALRGKMVPGEARPRLITRSGFEQKHILTSQIASG